MPQTTAIRCSFISNRGTSHRRRGAGNAENLLIPCGFVAAGSRLCIGTDDNSIVIGLENSRKLLEDIPNGRR